MKTNVITHEKFTTTVQELVYKRDHKLLVVNVYFNPEDFPGKFVARPTLVGDCGTELLDEVAVFEDFETLAIVMPYSLTFIPRKINDSPVIYGTYL